MATPLPPGAVSLDDALTAQSGLSVKPKGSVISQAYEDYVASPLTQLVSNTLGGPSSFGQTVGPIAGRMLVPQDSTELGIAAATFGAGPIAAKASSALGKGAIRLGAAALGGGAGALVEDPSIMGAAKGAAQGAAAGLTGEAIGTGVNFLRRVGMDRASAKMDVYTARELVDSFKGNPKLKGVFNDVPPTPEGLEQLVNGYVKDARGRSKSVGETKLGAFMDQADAKIGAMIQQKSQGGTVIQFPRMGADKPGVFGPWTEARNELTEFGSAVKRMHPHKEYKVLGETVTGSKAKQMYAEALRGFQSQLSMVDPQAATVFNESRGVYEAGMALIGEKNGLLPKAFKKQTYDRVMVNTDALMGALNKNRSDWVNRLGEEGYWSIAKALRLDPSTVGRRDIMQPTGKAATAAGVLPLPGAAYLRFQFGTPGFHNNPLKISPSTQTGLNFGASQGVGAGVDTMGPMAEQYGPLMLPGSQP